MRKSSYLGNVPIVRSYGQYCAVARSLDVVGDRWVLLIVRELLLRGPCRYTDIRDGLPGVATNLLAARLRHLEDAGVVRRTEAPPPIATTLYELTPRGSELAPVLHALGRWGAELMATPQGSDVFLGHWIAFPISRLTDAAPDRPPITIQIHTGDQAVIVETVDGSVRARRGVADDPDTVISGPPDALIALLRGQLDIVEADKHELRIEGDPGAVQRLQPAPSTSP